MKDIVYATFSAMELRVPDPSERIVEGIVVPWNETTFFTPDPKGERFLPGSLDRSVEERNSAIKLYRNHDHSRAVGKPLQWKSDHELGCWVQYELFRTPAGDDVLIEIQQGALDAFSVGFIPKVDRRGTDGAREIIEARLQEVSICPMGAYDGARVLATRTPAKTFELPPMPEVNLDPLPPLSYWPEDPSLGPVN